MRRRNVVSGALLGLLLVVGIMITTVSPAYASEGGEGAGLCTKIEGNQIGSTQRIILGDTTITLTWGEKPGEPGEYISVEWSADGDVLVQVKAGNQRYNVGTGRSGSWTSPPTGKNDTQKAISYVEFCEDSPPADVAEKVAIDLSCESITFTLTQGDEPVSIQEYDSNHNAIGAAIVLTPENPTLTRSVSPGAHWYSGVLNTRTKQWDPVIEACPKPPPPNVDEKVAVDYTCESITWTLTQGDEPVSIQEYDSNHNAIGAAIVLTPENPTLTRSVSPGAHWYSGVLNTRTKQWDPVIQACPKPPPPTTITVIKNVVNDDGGTAAVSSFVLYLNGSVVTSGATNTVNPGTYIVSEDQLGGYDFIGFSGDCDANGVISVDVGEHAICVLLNDDVPIPPPPPPSGECELVMTKAVDVTDVAVGDLVTFMLRFENIGTADCTGSGTRIMDLLPDNVSFLYAELSGNVEAGYSHVLVFELYDAETHSVNADANTLVPGETGWITITVKVIEPEACGDFILTNTGMITSRQYNTEGWHNGWENLNWIVSNEVSVTVYDDCVADADDEVPTCTCRIEVIQTDPETDQALERISDKLENVQQELEDAQRELEDAQRELGKVRQEFDEHLQDHDQVADPSHDEALNTSHDLLRYVLVALLASIATGAAVGMGVRRWYQLHPEPPQDE